MTSASRGPARILLAAAAAACVAALIPSTAAHAESRTGEVTVTIPSRIVIDGSTIPVEVSSDRLYSSLDKVDLTLSTDGAFGTYDEIAPNTSTPISTELLDAGSVVGRASLATTECSSRSTDPCHLRESDLYYYEFVNGLTYHDSAAAVAKYASRIVLAGVKKKTVVVWTATATRYDTGSWVPFGRAEVMIGDRRVTADRHGVAAWTEHTTARHRYAATVAETATVWASTSSTVRAAAPEKSVKTHVTSSSSAAAVGRAIAARVSAVKKVQGLTRKTDPNDLLGRPNGYSSAAVLHDARTECSDGPGADCGATIERWATAAKAKARSKYILKILDAAPALGSEYHAVHGRFLLRVSGDLTKKQAAAYTRALRSVF